MFHFQTFRIFPKIPKKLAPLEDLAQNLWWSWQHNAVALFRRISPRRWARCHGNPIVFLSKVPQARFDEIAADSSFIGHMQRVAAQFAPIQKSQVLSPQAPPVIAYFSMEFGLHESIPLVAGGLGILAGDHLKVASDTGLPLVGVGLLYRYGYFHQRIDADGWQQESYPETDFYQLPLQWATDADGNQIRVTVTGLDGRQIQAQVWKIMVGRVPLFLLDTNMVENPPDTRNITGNLYPGDSRMKLTQELLLGIGGMRALKKIGITPAVCHLNEGHCSFAVIERVAQIIQTHHIDLDTALEIMPRSTVFTTHTPVPAGHDEFPVDMIKPALVGYPEIFDIPIEKIISWGQPHADAPFSMAVLALLMTQHSNGVSKLHGAVARDMWAHIWPQTPIDDIPIGHVTNGVHIPTWLSNEYIQLFERYLQPEWHLHAKGATDFSRIDGIFDEEIWRVHEMNRSRLVRTCRELLLKQYSRLNAKQTAMQDAEAVLDPNILTIAFSRRFATYKRANLLFRNPERLQAILTSDSMPVQLIFAGKAHPKDDEGKKLIQQIIHFAREYQLKNRIVFIEDYDIHLSRHLVQGADVWLNTPRRPMEACGTSGMKAAMNGVLNLSILDGWWCEGYRSDRGWAIGGEETYHDPEFQDEIESRALYNLLENEVIPCFYNRSNAGLSECWIDKMKASMKMALKQFSCQRMVDQYQKQFYAPATQAFIALTADNAAKAIHLRDQRKKLLNYWNEIKIKQPQRLAFGASQVGDQFEVRVAVALGELSTDDVQVELYYGSVISPDKISKGQAQIMRLESQDTQGRCTYTCQLTCQHAGRIGFSARVVPKGDTWLQFTPGLITWAP